MRTGQILSRLVHQGNKLKGRVLDGGQMIAEQLAQENKVQWHHRDPHNLVARDTEPGQVKRRTFLLNPVGAQIETTEGVDLGQYYTCLYGAPNCNSGYNPQPPGGYGYHADQANGTFAAGFKVDGALTLLSPAEAAAQAGRSGNGSVYVSPGIWGTPMTNGLGGSFVRRSVSGWQEVAGHVTKNGKYERDYVETVVDVWEFVPGSSGSSQFQIPGRRQTPDSNQDSENISVPADRFNKCREKYLDGQMVNIPDGVNLALVAQADGSSDLILQAFILAIWAREGSFLLYPDQDHGPLQLTSAVRRYYPKVKIEDGAYDKFSRAEDSPRRKLPFEGSPLANLKTGVNLVRWRLANDRDRGSYYHIAYDYGPGKNSEGDPQPVARDKYARETIRFARTYLRFTRCLETGEKAGYEKLLQKIFIW